jgi:hypothetical protein
MDNTDTNLQLPSGGSGAAEFGVKVFGDMNQQQGDSTGAIRLNLPGGGSGVPLPNGGFGLTESLVPAVLILANNAITKRALKNSGFSSKYVNKQLPRGGENMPPELTEGGGLANTLALPVGLVLASNAMNRSLRKTVSRPRKFARKQRGKSRRFQR